MPSEAQRRATKKFEDKTYFKTLVRFKKADEERIRAAAGDSLNGFIVKCVLDSIETSQEDQQSRYLNQRKKYRRNRQKS